MRLLVSSRLRRGLIAVVLLASVAAMTPRVRAQSSDLDAAAKRRQEIERRQEQEREEQRRAEAASSSQQQPAATEAKTAERPAKEDAEQHASRRLREKEEEEEKGDKPRLREAWNSRGRTPMGESGAALRERALRQREDLRTYHRERAMQAQRSSRLQTGSTQTATSAEGVSASASSSTSASSTSSVSAQADPPGGPLAVGFASQWTALGPQHIDTTVSGQTYGMNAGRVTAVAVDAQDSTGNTVYIGAAYGGVWKSTNAADPTRANVTWTPLTDNQATLATGAIAIGPTPGTRNIILVGTGEANNSPDSYYGNGILRSADGGASWTLIPTANNGARQLRGIGFTHFAFSTANPNLVVATAAGNNGVSTDLDAEIKFNGNSNRGLYYSLDAGVNWNIALENGNFPMDSYSATSVVFYRGKFIAAVRNRGFYQSSDAQNWTRMTASPEPSPGARFNDTCASTSNLNCPIYRGEFAVNPVTNELFTWYMRLDSSFNEINMGIWRTTDGNSWTQITSVGLDSDSLGNGVCTSFDPTANGCTISQGSYNLTLAAIPNGQTGTDLFAGAVDLFRCRLVNGSATTCSNLVSPTDAWTNVSLVYSDPCFIQRPGATGRIHPDQHSLDYKVVGNTAYLFIANDGGVFRSRDAYSIAHGSTTSGTPDCTANPLEDVNTPSLGALTQFVDQSNHPSDPNILLGGTQDNGSPAFKNNNGGLSPLRWEIVNGGDGGYNAIDQSNSSNWYTSNNFSSSRGPVIERCTGGTSCGVNDFGSVTSGSTFAKDYAAFYFPYLLDPANQSRLIVGTCRVWRGNANGAGAFTALSQNFDVGSLGSVCGSGTTKVAALAVGGPMISGLDSKVIYAGMDQGGNVSGRIFVGTDTTNPGTWADVTGNINPGQYAIGDIKIDRLDTTGATAVAVIRGFAAGGTVYRTTNFGASWANISGKGGNGPLPTVPVNTVLVDPDDSNTVYVGTDVGVFATTNANAGAAAVWQEIGTGLPNTSVSRISMMKDTTNVKRLRAATYGRGVWELQLSAPNVPPYAWASSLDFGNEVVNVTSPSRSVKFTNGLTSAITVTGISASASYLQSNDCPSTLGAGASCTITVYFKPAAFGPVPGLLTITHSAAGSPVTVNLVGAGADVVLTFNRNRRTTRPLANQTIVTAGQSFTIVTQLSVRGSLQESVELSCSAPEGATCTVTPEKLDGVDAGDAKEVPIKVKVKNKGAKSGEPIQAGEHEVELKAKTPGGSAEIELPFTVRER